MTDKSLVIGSIESQWLRITPLRRTHPQCADYWDGNWVDSSVDVSVGAFAGSYQACLRTEEFKAFRVGLDHIYTTLKGEASFASMEDWVAIQVIGDGLGHFRAACMLRDAAGIGNTLKFELHFDQTELAVIVEALVRVEQSFPVIGQPNV